jgi:phosphotransferase system enzyme I (PtsP)
MIEVPLAVTMVEQWAGQVDFLCVGTNDLLASSMGVSRDDPVSEIVCDPLHPGLLHSLEHVIRVGHAAGKSVTICGELAASPAGAVRLAEMGADALSVAVDQILRVRNALVEWSTDISEPAAARPTSSPTSAAPPSPCAPQRGPDPGPG